MITDISKTIEAKQTQIHLRSLANLRFSVRTLQDLYVTGVQDGAAAVCLAHHIGNAVFEAARADGRSASADFRRSQ